MVYKQELLLTYAGAVYRIECVLKIHFGIPVFTNIYK